MTPIGNSVLHNIQPEDKYEAVLKHLEICEEIDTVRITRDLFEAKHWGDPAPMLLKVSNKGLRFMNICVPKSGGKL